MSIPDPVEVYVQGVPTTVAIQLTPFGEVTSTDEVRSVLGLSDSELPDEVITQRVYKMEVLTALTLVDSRLVDECDQRLLAKPSLKDTLGIFALYCIANRLCDALPLIAARTLSDNKATFQRFDIDIQSVAESIRQRYATSTKALQEALADSVETKEVRVPTLFGSGSPNYDRVTGS